MGHESLAVSSLTPLHGHKYDTASSRHIVFMFVLWKIPIVPIEL